MDRRSEEPRETFRDAVLIGGLTKSAWSAFRDSTAGAHGSPGKASYELILATEFSNRFIVMWSRAVQVFVAWDGLSSDKTTRGTLGGMKIKPIYFDFWSYDTALRVDPAIKTEVDDVTSDIQQNRMPIANLCRILGDSTGY